MIRKLQSWAERSTDLQDLLSLLVLSASAGVFCSLWLLELTNKLLRLPLLSTNLVLVWTILCLMKVLLILRAPPMAFQSCFGVLFLLRLNKVSVPQHQRIPQLWNLRSLTSPSLLDLLLVQLFVNLLQRAISLSHQFLRSTLRNLLKVVDYNLQRICLRAFMIQTQATTWVVLITSLLLN